MGLRLCKADANRFRYKFDDPLLTERMTVKIEIALGGTDLDRLKSEYVKVCETWEQLGNRNAPPSFLDWAGVRLTEGHESPPDLNLDDLRLFHGLERFVTSLQQHGLSLVRNRPVDKETGEPCADVAHLMAQDFKLAPQFEKRIRDLLLHYIKPAREVANSAGVGITRQAQHVLKESYERLIDHCTKSIASLGPERAIGRAEGAAAVLVSAEAMDAKTAQTRTEEFKVRARSGKHHWVDRLFHLNDKET